VRYTRLPAFLADWQALMPDERRLIKQWLTDDLLPAFAAYEADPKGYVWPAKLRFERIRHGGGICAVTWSFAGPDGRATFEFGTDEGQPCIIWRRIGHHDIYTNP